MKHLHLIIPAIGCVAALALSAMSTFAQQRGNRIFATEGGRMIVFPGDSIDLSTLTFIVDGDTVSRSVFTAIDTERIHSLTITKGPANCIEIVTTEAHSRPLSVEEMPVSVTYEIDGLEVDRSKVRSLPVDSISAIRVVRGPRPRLVITTDSTTSK